MANRFRKGIPDEEPVDTYDVPTPAAVPLMTDVPVTRFRRDANAPFPGPTARVDQFAPGVFNRPFGELKQAVVTPTEQLKWDTMSRLVSHGGLDPYHARNLTEFGFNVGAMTPMGSVLSAADLTHNLPRGNYGAAAFDTLGVIPGAMTAKRALKGVPEIIPAHTAPFRETRRAAPEIGGFVTPLPSEAKAAGRAGYRAIEQAPITYHPNAIADMTDWARNALPNPRFGPVFTPESTPNTYAMLERFGAAFPRGGPRPVNAWDWDTLRQGLLKQKGEEAAAGRQAADILDTYMLNPPKGMVLQGENLLPGLRETYGQARGNWRTYKTGDAVVDVIDAARIGAAGEHSGRNLGNRQRQAAQKYVKTPEGEAKLFGATPAQLDAIENVATGDRTTNALRTTGNLLGGGGGVVGTGMSGGVGATLGALGGTALGVGPWLGGALGAGATTGTGWLARNMGNARTAAQAQGVVNDIMRSSPLYRNNLAAAEARGMGAMADPRTELRDRLTMMLMPSFREAGTEKWNEQFVPYENR